MGRRKNSVYLWVAPPDWRPKSAKDSARLSYLVQTRQNHKCANCSCDISKREGKPTAFVNLKDCDGVWTVDSVEALCHPCWCVANNKEYPHYFIAKRTGVSRMPQPECRFLKHKLSESQNHRCCYCGIRFSRKTKHDFDQATFDHIVPKSEGGLWFEENLVLACQKCNGERRSKPALEYFTKKNPAYVVTDDDLDVFAEHERTIRRREIT